MAELIVPNSNEGLLTLFDIAVQVVTGDAKAGVNYAEPTWADEANAFLPNFRAKVRGLTKAQQRRVREVAERRAAVDKLGVYVRDFMNVLKRRVNREELPASYYEFFKLPLDGALPNPTAIADIMSWAEILVQGNADAVESKFEPMSNPSAAQVEEWLERTRAESADIPPAERDLDVAQNEVEDLRIQATEMARDLAAQLNFRLRKLDGPGRRRIIRGYGFKYRYSKGEPVDADEETASEGEEPVVVE